MPVYAILPLISGIFVFFLGFFVWQKNRHSPLNILFFLFSICVVIWLLGTLMMFTSKEDAWAIFWDRIAYIGVIFMPIIAYHFGSVFTKTFHKKILYAGYFLAFIFLISSVTDYFVRGLYKYNWGVHTQAHFLHHIFLIFFVLYMFLFFFGLYQYYRDVRGIERAQTKYVFLAFFVLALGSVSFLPAYGVGVYPFAYLLGVATTIILAYAILKYRLMDIRFVLGRGAVYALSFITVIAFAFLLMFLGNQFISAIPFNIIGPLILVISILLFQPIFRFFEKLASKYFYYTFYSYQTVLTNLGRKLTQVLELDKLSSSIVSTLMGTMKLDRTVILLREPGDGEYQIQKNIGFREENGISLVKDDFLTIWLEKTKKPLVYEELSLIIRDTLKRGDRRKLENLQSNMKRIEAALCLPLFIEEKIIGMIVLGSKVSGDPYSEQDIDLLTNLSNQASIALQNARLYSEIKGFSVKLEREVEKRTKELKDAYEELKKLDKAKSEFISIASHQLRTPLTAIKGYISMMREKLYGKPPEKMEKPLENIYLSNERLIKLVNDLLNVSRIEAGRLEMKLGKLSLEEIITSVVGELKNAAKEKGIYLKWEKPKKPLPKISVDRDKIRQVIMNVVDNAIRYTEHGGVTVKIQSPKSKIQIIVSDTGTGLAKYELSKMFESFSRGVAGTRLYTEGVGLGLYVARRFVEMHHGKIWAESKGKNKGTTFYIELSMK